MQTNWEAVTFCLGLTGTDKATILWWLDWMFYKPDALKLNQHISVPKANTATVNQNTVVYCNTSTGTTSECITVTARWDYIYIHMAN